MKALHRLAHKAAAAATTRRVRLPGMAPVEIVYVYVLKCMSV